MKKTLITKIGKYNDNTSYDIGVSSDNVAIQDESNKFSLTQLYGYLKNFFNKVHLLVSSSEEPTQDQVKIWLDTNQIPSSE